MKYSNPRIPEGINSSSEHPLKEFSLLLGGIGLLIMSAFIILVLAADYLAPTIPFDVEMEMAARYKLQTDEEGEQSKEHIAIQNYLQQLADQLAESISLPEEMQITIHYSDEKIVNAFATLGGNIIVYRGLLEQLPNENVLAMVMAHEIAHIKHRDPIKGMGRAVVLSLAVVALNATIGNQLVDQFVNSSSTLTVLHFSREQESAADEVALSALYKHYGHVNGSTVLYTILNDEQNKQAISQPEFLSTHPENSHRAQRIAEISSSQGWPQQGATIPLPQVILSL